jgi:hypothetical protein
VRLALPKTPTGLRQQHDGPRGAVSDPHAPPSSLKDVLARCCCSTSTAERGCYGPELARRTARHEGGRGTEVGLDRPCMEAEKDEAEDAREGHGASRSYPTATAARGAPLALLPRRNKSHPGVRDACPQYYGTCTSPGCGAAGARRDGPCGVAPSSSSRATAVLLRPEAGRPAGRGACARAAARMVSHASDGMHSGTRSPPRT